MAYVIAVVGAGGKSSLIEKLADAYAAEGKQVAVTTSTHIWKQADRHGVHYAGCAQADGKLAWPGDAAYAQLCQQYDVVLVEADGSRHKPAKIPAVYEPVIPPQVNEIVVVMGAHAIGRPFRTVCHRWALADAALLAEHFPGFQPETPVTEELLAFLAQHYYMEPLKKQHPGVKIRYQLSDMREQSEKDGRKLGLVLLASGSASRFGENKLLYLYRGKALYRWALDALLEASAELSATHPVFVYVLSRYPDILQAPEYEGRVYMVENPDYAEGIAGSVRNGAASAFADGCDAVAFFVADQPAFGATDIVRFLQEYLSSGKRMGCVYTDHPGNPAVFARELQAELDGLQGDRGAGVLLKRYPPEVHYHVVEAEKVRDIDSKEQIGE